MPGGQEPKEKKRKRPDRREDATEYVEELKKDEQEKREEREAAWAEQELSAKNLGHHSMWAGVNISLKNQHFFTDPENTVPQWVPFRGPGSPRGPF